MAFPLTVGIGVAGADVYLTPNDEALGQAVNAYRASRNLHSIPVTVSLTEVAQLHARDLAIYRPHEHIDPISGLGCTLRSWSDNGIWTPVCYVPDHRNAEGMWNKPHEITVYTGIGFELVAGPFVSSPPQAVNLWSGSSPHNDMLLNQGIWATATWMAMGVGFYEGYASVWFGQSSDSQGLATLPPDPATQITAPVKDLQDGPPLEIITISPGGDGKVGGFYGIVLSADGIGGEPNYRWSISGGPEALPLTMLVELPDTDLDGIVDDYFLTFAHLAEAGARDRIAISPYTLRLEALNGAGVPIAGSESEILLMVPEPGTMSILLLLAAGLSKRGAPAKVRRRIGC
jgi:hypothetical protein